MAEVDVMTQEEDEQQLADVLLLLISIQRLISLEFTPDIGQLLVDPFNLRFLAFT
jgi:hypothetical protein